jgi:phage protein D
MSILKPIWQIKANDKDVTNVINTYLERLTITDEAGFESDGVTIQLCDVKDNLATPPKGAILEVAIGWEGETLHPMGVYVVDAREFSGFSTITIEAQANPVQANSKFGKLQSHRSQTWQATTIGTVVKTIATRNGLKASISNTVASIALPPTVQRQESDTHFLTKLADKYDCTLKLAGGAIIFNKKGEASTPAGKTIPTAIITPSMVDPDTFTFTDGGREQGGTVSAKYKAKNSKTPLYVTAGSGDPTKIIKTVYQTQQQALQAVNAEYKQKNRGATTVNFTLAKGDPTVFADAFIQLQGFRKEANNKYLITSVNHNLDAGSGFTTTIKGELAL